MKLPWPAGLTRPGFTSSSRQGFTVPERQGRRGFGERLASPQPQGQSETTRMPTKRMSTVTISQLQAQAPRCVRRAEREGRSALSTWAHGGRPALTRSNGSHHWDPGNSGISHALNCILSILCILSVPASDRDPRPRWPSGRCSTPRAMRQNWQDAQDGQEAMRLDAKFEGKTATSFQAKRGTGDPLPHVSWNRFLACLLPQRPNSL